MRAAAWLAMALVGFGAMAWSYYGYQRIDPAAPWAAGVMFVPLGDTAERVPAAGPDAIVTRLRLLPIGAADRQVVEAAAAMGRLGPTLKISLAEKLIRLAPAEAGIGEEALARGRLPIAGRDEVLAGAQVSHPQRLEVAGRTLHVVGVLRRDAALVARSYLLPPGGPADGLFDPKDESVRTSVLVRLAPGEARDEELQDRWREAYPATDFAALGPSLRAPRGPFYLYVSGLAVMMLGGSGLLIRVWAALARWYRGPVIGHPLAELASRRGLLWSVHVLYFGLVLLVSVVVYETPALQSFLTAAIRREIASGRSPLGAAGQAYLSGNIPLAAAVTLLVNFLLGALVVITLPSLVVPGAGILTALFRALLWGVVVAPTSLALAMAMLPHSWTMLLEGEGYILAAFFGLLVPVYLVAPDAGRGAPARYGRALLVNLKGSLLVAAVLAVSAVYEAVEVILMSR